MQKIRDATGAVAALPGFPAIGIENAVANVRSGLAGGLDQQQLIAADTEVPIREKADLLACQLHGLFQGIDDDEVIAETMHLCEIKFHE